MKEKKSRIRRKNAGYKKLVLLLIIVFILILIITKVIFPTTVSLSKFVYSVVRGAYLSSREFYFTSNRMTRTDTTYEVKNWDGVGEHKVDVNMYSSKNSLKKANVDIEYDISVEVQAYSYAGSNRHIPLGNVIKLGAENGNKIHEENDDIIVDLSDYKSIISKIGNQDDFYVVVTPNHRTFKDEDYIEIKFKATATSPYTDTIKGTYKAYVGTEGISYRIEDSANSPYLNVILTNAKAGEEETASVDATLEFDPDVVVLDTTSSEYIKVKDRVGNFLDTKPGTNYFNKISVRVEPLESIFVKFYKKNIAENYSYPNDRNDRVVLCKVGDKNLGDN